MPWLIGAAILLLILTSEAYAMKRSVEKDSEIQSWIMFYAEKNRVDPNLIRALIKKESSWDPEGINPSDPSFGLMAITPILAQDYSELTGDVIVKDWRNRTAEEVQAIFDPETNLKIGCWNIGRYLPVCSLEESIQMYNLGRHGYLSGGRVPDYLEKVLRFYDEYSRI